MTEQPHDVIVIGFGAGGAAVAQKLVNAGKRVLMPEKGDLVSSGGSTLDVKTVFAEGRLKNQRLWVDGHNQQFVPGEFNNVGGKTKWYGAPLLRFAPHEVAADEAFACRGWLIAYDELTSYYAEAEQLLHVAPFQSDPELAAWSTNSARMAAAGKKSDVLRKTAIFFNDAFPRSPVQCLGQMDGEIMASQLPAAVPRFVTNAAGRRAYGFFVTTEDGSRPDNRIISCGQTRIPVRDYDLERIRASVDEHHAPLSTFGNSLLRAGMLGVHRFMGLADTAHALGSLFCGNDPADSMVDAAGKVHGMDNLYVADGRVLPYSSGVNPALTIYASGLRLAQHLGKD